MPAPGAPPFVTRTRLAALLLGSALVGGLAFRGGAGVATAGDDAPTGAAAPTFTLDVAPLVASHCASCHGKASPAGGLDLTAFVDEAHALASAKVWRRVADRVARGEMPPKDAAKPPQAALDRLRAWVDRAVPPPPPPRPGDPGRVTLRRLTKAEYHATIRDLLAVDETSSPGFPSDDVGYGFDRIGDVLSLPPLLLEKYLSAAERISEQAIVVEGDGASTPTRRLEAESIASTAQGGVVGRIWKGLFTSGDVHGEVRLPREGEYRLRVRTFAQQAGDEPAKVVLLADGGPAFEADVTGTEKDPQVVETLERLRGCTRVVGAAFPNDLYDPKAKDAKRRDRNLFVDWIEVEGPLDPPPPPPESHRRIFAPDPGGTDLALRASKILGPLASRAWRRPVERDELRRLVWLVTEAAEDGAELEEGVRIALQAILVSPHFLFHVVLPKAPDDPQAEFALDPYALAERLSYFLWSSLPDAKLTAAAADGSILTDAASHVRRMLADPRAGALVDGFAQQWLTLRRLPTASPDTDRFPAFTDRLREDMLRETEMFFEAVMTEDRSVLDFVDGRFTFLNERLAKHYGIPGVAGERFRRVALDGEQRAGIFTQASVLTVTSYPTRTSPVRRGKWLLEQVLGASVPPPPPGAGDLPDHPDDRKAATLRQRMERHLKDPGCAACHRTLDPLGFGLEAYDAVGAWRTRDGAFPLDTSGTLPDGRSFSTPAELRAIVRADPGFVRCFAEKLLTYALGRGLTEADAPAVARIVSGASEGGWRFSRFVEGVVDSVPFRKGRGEEASR